METYQSIGSSRDGFNVIVAVTLLAIVISSAYLLLKFVLYWKSGVWISSVNIFLWKLRGLYFTNKKLTLKLRSFGIRINLFDSHHKLINFNIEGLNIEINDEISKTNSKKRAPASNTEELLSQYLRPISIYPKSELVRFSLRHLTRFIPSIGVKVTDIKLSVKNTPIKFCIAELELSTDYKIHSGDKILKFVTNASVSEVNFTFKDERSPISSMIIIRLAGIIDLQEGIISNLSNELKSFSLTIPTFSVLKCFVFIRNHFKEKQKKQPDLRDERPPLKRSNDSLFAEDVCFASLVVNLIKETSLRFDNVTIDKIPLISSFELSQICNDDFLTNYGEQLVFLKFQLKSISANYSVLKENNAGFDINFQKGDHPFQFVVTAMQSLISLDLSHLTQSDLTCKPIECYELLNIPSITISSVTNTLYALLKRIEKGTQYADALLNYNCSVSNPIIDISTEHLGIIISRLLTINYHNKIHKKTKEKSSTKPSAGFSRLEYVYYLSSIWPALNLKLLVERPTLILKTTFKENHTMSMAVLTTSLINIGVVTTKSINFDGDLVYYLRGNGNVSDLKLSFIKKMTNQQSSTPDSVVYELARDQQIMKSSELNLKFDSRILPDAKIACHLDYGSFSIDLSNLVILNGLSEILTDIDDNVVHLTFNQFSELEGLRKPKAKTNVSQLLREMVFRDLPDWFDSFKMGGSQFKVVTGTRSVLIPAELVTKLNLPDIIDNVDGNLRKISFSIADWHLDINNNKSSSSLGASTSEDPMTKDTITAIESDTSSSEEGELEEYWKITSTWKNANSKVYTEAKSQDGEVNPYSMKAYTMSKLPNLTFSLRSAFDSESGETALKLEGDCDQVSIQYSLINHFLIISSFHLLNNTLFKPALARFRKTKDTREAAIRTTQPNDTKMKLKEFLKVFHVRIHLHQFSVVNRLAEDFNIKMDGVKTVLLLQPGSDLLISNCLFRILVESPTSPGYWTRFISVNSSKIRIDFAKILNKGERLIDEIGTVVDISNSGARVGIPHQFVVHKLFDQVSVAYKTIKQLHHSLKYNDTDIVIYPHEMKTPRFPKIKLRSKRFMFRMEDDPFESELSMIFELGAIEQRRRLEKFANFKAKLQENLQSEHVEAKMNVRNINVDGLLEPETIHKHSHNLSFNNRNSTDPGPLGSPSIRSTKNDNVTAGIHKIDEWDKKLFLFRKHLSRSWIELVRDYRQKMNDKIDDNSKFLWGLLKPSSYPPSFNHKLIGYPKSAPLMFMTMENVELTIKSPNFPLEKVPEYIHDIGKGVPLTTKYTIMFPMSIDLKVKELRIHIRDYPLPLFFIPEISQALDQNLSALRITGTFVVGEELSQRPENIRTIYVPLVPAAKKSVNDKYFALNVPKTIASIKVFTNLQININTENSTRFTWGQSYQPALQQIILNFDNFSKPQLDPSEKVGFWDKVRSILHARVQFKWRSKGELIVSLKGGRNPYHLMGTSAGFLLIFKDNVVLDINKEDNPKEFLCARSGEVGWSIANHFALPLLTWYKESSQSLFVPDTDDMYLRSVAGYYLEDQEGYNPARLEAMSKLYQQKNVIRLSGNVLFKIGLSFERDENGHRTHEFRPHYDVKLSNPIYVKDVEHYDAYDGFRSKYAHMSLSLSSPENSSPESQSHPNKSYNVAHLSPAFFFLFFAWWKLFSGNMELPVRRGPLFGPNMASKKFSEVLSTFQFQFLISPLHLSHIYRDEVEMDTEDSKTECLGLKTKVDSFTVDLHQRKEAIVNKYSELDKTKSIQKMKMYLGEVDIANVDLRAVKAIFKGRSGDDDEDILEFGEHANYADGNVFKTFDNDISWLDLDDFEEVGLCSIKNSGYFVRISPLLFTPRFTYLRQLDHSVPQGITPADNELAHDCVLGANKFIETQKLLLKSRLQELENQLASATTKRVVNNLSKGVRKVQELLKVISVSGKQHDLADEDAERGFNNKFLIHNVQVKWNTSVRDIVFRYYHFLTMRRASQHYLRYQSYATVEKIMEDQRRKMESEEAKLERFQTFKSEYLEEHHTRRDEFTYDDITCSQRLENFDEDLRKVLDSSFRSSDDYLIKLISPQIQLCTDDVESDSCVLITSPEIELKIVSIKQSSSFDENGNVILIDNEDAVLEKRYGSLFKDANIFVVYKKEVVPNLMSLYTEDCYGSTSNWPPWIGVELCYDGESLNENMILRKTSLVFRYDQVRDLITNSNLNDRKRVIVDIPQVVTSCDSDQYYAFYDMVLNLLMYKEPSDTEFHEKLTSLILTTDFTDLYGVRDRIRNLQTSFSTLRHIGESLAFKRVVLSEEDHKTLVLVTETKNAILSELFLLMRLVSKGTTSSAVNKDEELEWTIRADKIIVHMLDETRSPFVDLIVKDGVFRRIEESSNSNTNIVQVSELDAYNLEKNAVFPEMMTSYNAKHGHKEAVGNGHLSSEDADKTIVLEWVMDIPVGGIKVVRSVIVNLLPLKISLDQSTGEKLFNYLFPPTPDNPHQHKNILTANSVKVDHNNDDEKLLEMKRKKRGLAPRRLRTFINDGDRSGDSSELSSVKSRDSNKNRSFLSLRPAKTTASLASSSSSIPSIAARTTDPKYVSQMINRASTYMSIVALTINSFVLNISFRGEGKYRLVNVSNLTLKLPKLQFQNKIWTIEELFNHIKKLVIKALLNHSGVIIANKLTLHKRKSIQIRRPQEDIETIN